MLDRTDGAIRDLSFRDLSGLVAPGDALVLNDSKVFPARLLGRKPTGAAVEVLLLAPIQASANTTVPPPSEALEPARVWTALVRPGGKLKPGRSVEIAPGFGVEVLDSAPDGSRTVRLEGPGDPWDLIERHGHVPLPPYIDRPDLALDRDRYQTVYAAHRGSVAAPTAGLHFTSDLLSTIEAAGVRIVRLTLHVGIGTFRPVEAERLEDHEMHAERYEIDEEAARALAETKRRGGRIWAVGTTSCRALESAADHEDRVHAGDGSTTLFVHPPYEFRVVDCMVTNFHLPRSSLLMLVAAFAGLEPIREAYEHAIREHYRFYSYGDAMAIL